MNKQWFKFLAQLNKMLLPSFSKRRLDPSKFNKMQLAVLGWRAYVTKRALD
ncbi:MAG: SsrA-binding protein [Flavobacteriales bacterium]|nr:SsrA-binding protein [Flavobacteriales bacterium]